MKMKYAISASAFVLGAVLAGGAMAQQTAGADHNSSASNSNVGSTNTNVGSTNLSIPGLNNNNLMSNNTDNSNNSVNTNTTTNTDASNHQDNSSHSSTDSHNSTNLNLNARLVLASQDLSQTVSNVSFGGGNGGHDNNRSANSGAISWSGGAYQGFGGIQTESVNSGFASANQASTMVSANSNVTFGH